MKLNRKIDGAYSTWRLSISAEPLEEDGPLPDWPAQQMEPVFQHFFQVLCLLEAGRELGRYEPTPPTAQTSPDEQ